jgi:hypothetical protein
VQEFGKTAFQDFGPSFRKRQKGRSDIFSKHPPKTANQEFGKTAFQDFGPFFAFFSHVFTDLQIRSIMVCT